MSRPTPGLRAALADAGVEARFDEPLRKKGIYRLGGSAEAFAVLTSPAPLQRLMAAGVPVTVIGRGSNLLIADAGVSGLVVQLKGDFLQSTILDGDIVEAGGGLFNNVLLNRLSKAGVGGLGCLQGIPGTVGGAVRMNAGWSIGEIAERLVDADVILPDGRAATLTADELGFSYRRADGLPHGAVVVRVRLRLLTDPAAVAEEAERVARFLARRKATQPINKPSCGSVFKNPPGDYAGRLIEDCGLKGRRIGGAQISTLHANFIVNDEGGSAGDVYALIRLARCTVWRKHRVVLTPEVHAVGDWPEDAWPMPHPEDDPFCTGPRIAGT